MAVPEPTNRNEAMLLHSFLFTFANVEDRIIAFSDGGLSTGPGARGYGLLLALDTGIFFFIDFDKVVGANWDEITKVSVRRKLIGRSVAISTKEDGILAFHVTSATLGRKIQDLWRASA